MHCKLIITELLKHAPLQQLSSVLIHVLTLVIPWTGYHNCKKKKGDEKYHARITYILPERPPHPLPHPLKKHNHSIHREGFQNNFHHIFLMNVL